MQEVSRAHSTKRLHPPLGKEQIQHIPLHPQYVVGFIDGEGCFYVGVNRHKTLKGGIEISAAFSIELRADDADILKRILSTLQCGKIYDCSYERYGWYPHVKLKVSSTKEMEEKLFPFLDRYPLQAKKAKAYQIFREIIMMKRKKEHLSPHGFQKILRLRNEMRKTGKKHTFSPSFDPVLEAARIRENRSSGGVRR